MTNSLRVGEALALTWNDVGMTSDESLALGYQAVRDGKSKNARRRVNMTSRVHAMLAQRHMESEFTYVFGRKGDKVPLNSSRSHEHVKIRKRLNLPKSFVLHSLRHTALTRLGQAGADAFVIQRIAGHYSVTVSERYVHPSQRAVEQAFSMLERQTNEAFSSLATAEDVSELPTISTTVENSCFVSH